MKNIYIYLFLFCNTCFCAVRSTDGNLQFDVQMDGQPEMTLNSMGLGIGAIPSTNLSVAGNVMITKQLFVGGNSGSSNLNVNGMMGFRVQEVNSNTTLGDSSVVLVNSSSDNIIVTLPYAGNVSGRIYTIKKTSLNNVVQLNGGGNLIDSSSYGFNLSSGNLGVLDVFSNGINWYILSKSVSVSATSPSAYMVVDVSSGATATTYPVTYTNATPDLTGAGNLEFKTSKIVLKWIESGQFTMGNTTVGATPEHPVVLTEGFYAGVFEVTQQQWLNVMGSYPTGTQNNTNTAAGNTLPLQQVSWEDIRGASATYDWPTTSTVGANTFMGNLLAKTGLAFDLPTEAEWEYTCLAGTTTIWSYGDTEDGNYMWYTVNNTPFSTKEVGGKLPNPWGLYDMHGNVWEWCRDWYAVYPTSSEQSDPSGASSGSNRVRRGGGFSSTASSSPSANRSSIAPNSRNFYLGLRLFVKP